MNDWIIGLDKPEAILQSIRAKADSMGRTPIVCFDYFDTLVTRCVEPEQTKHLAAGLLSQLFQGRIAGETLYRFRREIEYDLCIANAKTNGEHEFDYEDLGRNLWERLKRNSFTDILPAKDLFIRKLLALDLAVEKAVQRLCREVFRLLLDLQRLEFKLLLVSDFYLPEPEFKKMLAWHGLDRSFAKIYVSTEQKKSKGSGLIYPKICEDLGVEPGRLLMIGDNPHADIRMARQHGLQAIHVHRSAGGTGKDQIKNLDRRMAKKRKGQFQQIVLPEGVFFPEIACSLWLFTHRLFEKLNSRQAKHVFFLSKEGEFLKKLFDQYQCALFGESKIQSHYLLASRRATFIASLRSLDEEDFARLFNHYRDISIREFLQSLNFDNDTIDRLCAKLAGNCNERLPETSNSRIFRNLIGLQEFQDIFETKRCEQRSFFLTYLDSFGVDYETEGFYLVDVGWKGSIQDNIYFILGKKVALAGYYVGSLNATERSDENAKEGLLFDNNPCPSQYLHVYNCNRSLFEMVLGASHGSAREYRKAVDNRIVENNEGNGLEVGGAGGFHPCVTTEELPEERHLFAKHIKPLQEKVLELNALMNNAYIIEQVPPPAEWFARQHARMVFFPKKEEIDWFESLYHYENFGIFEYTAFDTTHHFSRYERLIHLKNIIKDRAVLESGIWPPIILRRFGVGFWHRIDGLRRYCRVFGWMP